MEVLTTLYSIIRYDFIVGFVVYSILFSVVKHFISKSSILFEFDIYACKVLMVLVYGLIIINLTGIVYNHFNDLNLTVYLNRPNNLFNSGLIEHIILALLVQFFRLKILRLSIIFRLLVSIPLLVTFEQYVIIVTSWHRGHIPSAWQDISWLNVSLGLSLKMILFLILTSLAFFSIRYYLSQKKQPHQ